MPAGNAIMFDKLFRRERADSMQQQAEAILQDALSMPPMQGLGNVDAWLSDRFEKALQRQSGIRLLLGLDDLLRQLVQGAERTLLSIYTNPTKTTLLLQAALPFSSHLQSMYSQALQQEAATMAKHGGQNAALQSAIANCLFWSGKRFLLQFLQSPQQTFRWDQVQTLHEYAHKLEVGGLERLSGNSSQLPAVRRQLAYLLLLSRSLASDLNGRQTLLADRIVEQLSPMVMLSQHHSADTPFGLPGDNGPPTVSADRHASPPSSLQALYFGLGRCVTELQSLEQLLLQQQHVPARLDPNGEIDIAEALTVLRSLRMRWSGKQVTRKAKRIVASGEVRVIYEFPPIRRVISLRDQADKHHGHEPTQVKAHIADISASGLGLLLKPGEQWARIGRLVGIKQPDTPCWSVGIVRRFAAREGAAALIGVQVLAVNPESVRLVEKSADSKWERITEHDVYRNILAILIPGPDNKSFSLLTPGKVLMPGHEYGMALGSQTQEILVRDLLEVGSDFALYQATTATPHNPIPSISN